MDITEISVYDPKTDGLDLKTYTKAVEALRAINQSAEYAFIDGVMQRVSDSKVEEGITLERALSEEEGFFEQNPDIRGVLFIDGKLFSTYKDQKEMEEESKRVSELLNSIPFMYLNLPELQHYIEEREFTDAAAKIMHTHQ